MFLIFLKNHLLGTTCASIKQCVFNTLSNILDGDFFEHIVFVFFRILAPILVMIGNSQMQE